MKLNVGIDLDGVCYDMVNTMREWLHSTRGVPKEELPDAKVWDFFDHQWGFSSVEFGKEFKLAAEADFLFTFSDPIPGCQETIRELYDFGHSINFISARNIWGVSHDLAYEQTYDWLVTHQIPFTTLNIDTDKTVKQTDVFLEDNVQNYHLLDKTPCTPFLYTQEWNKDEPARRVFSWEEFGSIIRRSCDWHRDDDLVSFP